MQVFVVLPTGALFLAGGGDDLPVLALSLFGIAAVAQRREVAAGVAFGLAMAMKLTAWPIALLSLLVLRDRHGRRAAGRAGAIMAVIVAVVVIPFFVWDPHTFYENVLAFPLGLSGVNSPAASPLPGHLLVSLVPAAHRVLLVGLAVVGTPFLVWWLWRRPPRDVADVCRLTAVIAIVVMCVAPATRVGYVVYPVNLLLWSWLFTSVEPTPAAPVVEDRSSSEPARSGRPCGPCTGSRARTSAEVGDLEQAKGVGRRPRRRCGGDDAGLPVEAVGAALLEEDLVPAAGRPARRDDGPARAPTRWER